jgi:membrane protease YdiL (CAAX protease family)
MGFYTNDFHRLDSLVVFHSKIW